MKKEADKEQIQLKAAMLVIEQEKKMITEIIKGYEDKLEEVENNNKRLAQEADRLLTEKKKADESVGLLSMQLADIYTSKTWMLTKPIRYANSWAKKILKKDATKPRQ